MGLEFGVKVGNMARDNGLCVCVVKPHGVTEEQAILTGENLSNFFGYFKVIHTCHDRTRFFDRDGQVHLAKGKTGGHQGE